MKLRDFDPDAKITHERLVYSAVSRCKCGAGLAYDEWALAARHEPLLPEEVRHLLFRDPMARVWVCAAVLLEEVNLVPPAEGAASGGFLQPAQALDEDGNPHVAYPFSTYDITSESEGRGSTRPVGAPGHVRPERTPEVNLEATTGRDAYEPLAVVAVDVVGPAAVLANGATLEVPEGACFTARRRILEDPHRWAFSGKYREVRPAQA